MLLLDGSDSAWLVYSDWLEEQGQYDLANLIRAEVEESPSWDYESIDELFGKVGGIIPQIGTQIGTRVGSRVGMGSEIGSIIGQFVGGDR